MSAQAVPPHPGLSVVKYSIIGNYSDELSTRFVSHLAITREDGLVTFGAELPVWQMSPPLFAGAQESTSQAHVAAWLELTPDEREGIADWLAEVDKENRPATPSRKQIIDQYSVSIDPKDRWHYDEKKVPLYRKFSCVTFVLDAYDEGAGITLLDLSDPERLPPATLDQLTRVYPAVQHGDRFRGKVGVEGDGPWHIPLPGHVCHAMTRPDEEIRTSPCLPQGAEAAVFPPVAGNAR